MEFFRVGVVDFFGVLCPGILLLININVFLFAVNVDIAQLWSRSSLGKSETLAAIILFVVAYLFGLILRLLTPDYLDKLSSCLKRILASWFNKERKEFADKLKKNPKEPFKRGELTKAIDESIKTMICRGEPPPRFYCQSETYPYYHGHKHIYSRDMPHVFRIMEDQELHNKNNYNYWKVILTSKDQNLASLVFQAEALVRFMAGSFWALCVGYFSGCALVISGLHGQVRLGNSLAITSLIALGVILWKFQNQRHREVKILLDAMFVSECWRHPDSHNRAAISLPALQLDRKDPPDDE